MLKVRRVMLCGFVAHFTGFQVVQHWTTVYPDLTDSEYKTYIETIYSNRTVHKR